MSNSYLGKPLVNDVLWVYRHPRWVLESASGLGGSSSGSSGAGEIAARYVVTEPTGSLTNAFVLTAGSGISITSGSGLVTISTTGSGSSSGMNVIQYHDTTYGPVGLWNLSGSILDSSGYGIHLTSSAGNTRYTNLGPGLRGMAFDGASMLTLTASIPPLLALTGALSVEMLGVIPVFAGIQVLFAIGGTGDVNGSENYLVQYYVTANGRFGYFAEFNAGTNISAECSASVVPHNQLCHLALTRSSTGTLRFYVNGSQLESLTTANLPNTGSVTTATSRVTIGSAEGGSFSTPGSPCQLGSSLASVKLLNRELTVSEIYSEYARTLGNLYAR